MRTLLFVVVFGVAFKNVVAQQKKGIDCIIDCSTVSLPAGQCKSITEFDCICVSGPYQAAVRQCLQDKCAPEDMQTAMDLNQQGCGDRKPPSENTPPPPPEQNPPIQPEEQNKSEQQNQPAQPEEQNKSEQQNQPTQPEEQNKSEQQSPPTQSEQQTPPGPGQECVMQCAQEALSSGPCNDMSDLACICTNANYQQAALACMNQNCAAEAIQEAVNLQQQTCTASLSGGSGSNGGNSQGSGESQGQDQSKGQGGGSECLEKCSTQSLSAETCSDISNLECICTNTKYQQAVGGCIQQNCSDQLQAAMTLQKQTCTSAGGSITGGSGSGQGSKPPSAGGSVTGASGSGQGSPASGSGQGSSPASGSGQGNKSTDAAPPNSKAPTSNKSSPATSSNAAERVGAAGTEVMVALSLIVVGMFLGVATM